MDNLPDSIIYLCLFVSFLQLLVIGFVAQNSRVLVPATNPSAQSPVDEKKPLKGNPDVFLIDDYFYIYWNTSCCFTILFYLFAREAYPDWIGSLAEVSNLSIQNIYEILQPRWLVVLEDFFLVHSFILVVGCVAIWVQLQKSSLKDSSRDLVKYWWSYDLCRIGWWIRTVALFFNMVAFAWVTWKLTSLSTLFLIHLDILELKPNVFHPDKMAGFSFIGDAITLVGSVYLIRGAMGIVGWIDHHRGNKAQHLTHDLTDAYNVAYLAIGVPALFIWPALYFYHLVGDAIAEFDVAARAQRLQNEFQNMELSELKTELDLLSYVDSVASVPIQLDNFGLLFLSWFTSVFVYMVRRMYFGGKQSG